ncbi:hypothetical protein SAY86_028308 [Trapa natans]|uniref:Solanesyl diphosphate synthase n=1 Tax=Trapa natans TaxID=22666 RepID=A0AAN7MCP0_TRANT|nr:hypothetical protein SAY86_028308 [Trapa natans]
MMMSVACGNLDFGRSALDVASCGCSSNVVRLDRSSSLRCSVKTGLQAGKNRAYVGKKLDCFRRVSVPCQVFPTKTSGALFNDHEITQGPPQVLEVKDEPRRPISLANVFEVVADDLQALNQNLRSIVGADNPVLMSAAEQIFGAGGKRMRPALVFLASRATAEMMGLKELTREHRRLAEIIEMIHTASLIHDDVLDDSDMRRGKETVHQLFGTRVAVLAGDFMFAQSSWYLANLENLEVIKLISQVKLTKPKDQSDSDTVYLCKTPPQL